MLQSKRLGKFAGAGVLGALVLLGQGALGALAGLETYTTASCELRYRTWAGGSEVAIVAISPRTDIPAPDGGRDLRIPEAIDGLPVTRVAQKASAGIEDLRNLEIPASVSYIGSKAFSGCVGLTSVCIFSTTVKCEAGAFAECPSIAHVEIPGHLVFSRVFPKSYGELREATVVEGSTRLANNFAKGCTNLVSVTLPLGLEEIGGGAFESCSKLAMLEIPPSVVLVGTAFTKCAALTELAFPAGLRKIGRFSKCTSLKELTFSGDCPKGGGVDGKIKLAGVVVRAPASANGWPVNGKWKGCPLEFYNSEDVEYDVPRIAVDDVVSGLAVGKSVVLSGCTMDYRGKVTGILSLKIGRAGKKGSRLSATATDLQGKSILLKRKVEDVSRGVANLKLNFQSRNRSLQVTLGRDARGNPVFTGWLANDIATSAQVGGMFEREAVLSFPEGHPANLPQGRVEANLLPAGERVEMSGGKWRCAKAASVDWKKGGGTEPSAWVVNGGKVNPDRGNLSGLKLRYRPQAGTFTGSYRVYVVKDGRGWKRRVKVTGVVVDGVGYGVAAVEGMAPWRVLVR